MEREKKNTSLHGVIESGKKKEETMHVFIIGGAADPEMRMMESIIHEAGMPFAYATAGGKPCHPGNAYKADPVVVPEGYNLVVIECEPANIGDFPDAVHIDHHRPQDPGFNMGPAQYWEASSVGQLHRLLGIEPTQAAKVMAAFDHCFPAAVMGQCPGVSSNEVLGLKIEEIAKGTGMASEDIRGRIVFFRGLLAGVPDVVIGEQVIKDLRVHYMGEGYSLDLLTAQVAAAIEGIATLVRLRDRAGEPEKIALSGNARPETVQTFLEKWAPAHGLVRTYGVPARGYAGGYVA